MQNTTKAPSAAEKKQSIWTGVNRVRVSDFVIAFVILILSLTCILPFLHVAAKSISSNTAVMSNHNKVINFCLRTYCSIFYCPSVDTGICTYLNIITNCYRAQRRDFVYFHICVYFFNSAF